LRRGFDVNDAQDLTQDFFLSILEGDFLRQVDPNRGRFRSLLLKALQNFLNDVNERHRAKKRGREALSFVSWDDWMAEAPSRFSLPSQAIESWPPERLFDVRWAATVVEKSLRRLREECEARGRRRVFDSLSSSLSIERSDISYEELGKTLGVSSTVVKRLVFRLRQRYAALLREEVSATVAASENVDEELRYLCATLAAHEDEIAQIQSGLPIGAGSTSNIRGIPDSVLQIDRTCPRCGVTARVVDGKCLSCLLPIGLERQATEAKSFGAVLEETGIRDIPWRFGNYQVLEEIGRGSMGVIYRARQRHSKRIVALKRILSDLAVSSGTLERFRRETEAAAALDHPNIVPIYEIGEVDGLPFFTMKHATGGTLQSAARASLRNDPQHCVRLVVKIAHAIAYAHREGILHRDLKPGNILLDSRGEPMVSDFGLAQRLDASSDTPRAAIIFGTPGFIAPEQASGDREQLTPAADIYSLGAILFDLLAGRPPFVGADALAVIRGAANEPAPRLRSFNPSLDTRLEMICAKCLERKPQARYHSADKLAKALERWLQPGS
jgi:DNA-directed RNA polymerase specialized sigma24 family protein/tRNA A-37 threonylcarbamoyl transferase component Bud32